MDITQDGVLLCIELSSYTGAAKLEWQDMGVLDAPDKDKVSSGSKRLIDKAVLQPFGTIATQAGRVCDEYGIKLFKRCWFVSNGMLPELSQKLDTLRLEWDKAVQEFIDNYEAYCTKWLDACRNDSRVTSSLLDAIRSAQPDIASLGKRFRFGVRAFGIQPVTTVGDTEAMLQSLPDEALEQILDLLRKSGRNKNSLVTVAERCEAFAFVNPRIAMLKSVLEQLAEANNQEVSTLVVNSLLDGDAVGMIDKLVSDGVDTWVASQQQQPMDNLVREAEAILDQPKLLDSSYVLDSLGLF